VVASTKGKDALQKKLMPAITTNSHQKLLPKNTPAKQIKLDIAAICTMATRLPERSAIQPQIFGAKMRITASSDIRMPISTALKPSDFRYGPNTATSRRRRRNKKSSSRQAPVGNGFMHG